MNKADFKIEKALKLNWLKNASENGGAQEIVINSKPADNIIIHSINKRTGRMWADAKPADLLRITSKDNGIYEVICHFPHKVYFDIDRKNVIKDDNFKDKIIDKINDLFPNGDVAISGSITDAKESYHIVLNNYLINNEQDRDYIKSIVKYLNQNFDDAFDWKVYTKNRNMKAINQSKNDGRIQSIIMNEDATKHFITCYFNDDILPLPEFEEVKPEIKLAIEIDKAHKTFNLGTLPKLSLTVPQQFDINNCSVLEILSMLPLDDSFDHTYTHLVARFCYYNDITLEEFLSWYSKKSTNRDKQMKWANHWKTLNKFPEVPTMRMITMLIKFYPNLKKHKGHQQFIDLFDIPKSNIKKLDKLEQSIFDNNDKFTIINTGMGSGKTYQTLKYLKDKESFIWMTPIEALAQNTKHRLEEDEIDCKYYKDFKNKADKTKNMKSFDRLIICINSLPYTVDKSYKVVVIDEIETLLNKWFNNDTFKNNKLECWDRFIDIIEQADKVIFLDAFTSNLTINFINSLRTARTNTIYELNNEVSNRTIKFMASYYNWLNDIINDIKNNKKPFIFYPYLRANKDLPSMEELKAVIEKETNKNGVCYNSQIDDSVLKGLKNVNESWSSYDFVITNTKITVGINYDRLDDFDTVYLSIAGFNSSRDIIQVSYRCRNIKSNLIKVCYIDKMNTHHTFENDDHLVNDCVIYKSLVKDILIEKKAPLKQSFLYLCNKAHYRISSDIDTMNKGLEDYFKKLFDEANLGYSYDTIPTVEEEDIQILEQKIFSQSATLEDKITVKKYFFKKKFNNIDEHKISIAWDNRYHFFFDKIKELKENEDNVYNQIRSFNKWSSIFPTDEQLNKVKLNDALINLIFEQYHFKDLNKTSSHKCIIKNIYNSYFGKKVIGSIQDGKNNFKLTITDEVREMYIYGLHNIKIHKKLANDPFMDDIKSQIDCGISFD